MAFRSRRETPKQYSDYRKYKPSLRREFDYACVYCLARESEVGGASRFHVDHYRPKRFKSFISRYTNLFYSCPNCNQLKSDYWPSLVQAKVLGQFILNPCDHDVDHHIDRTGEKWLGKTRTGEWNILRLKLSSPMHITRRKDRTVIEGMIAFLEKQKRLAEAALKIAQQKNVPSEISAIQIVLNETSDQIDALKRKVVDPKD